MNARKRIEHMRRLFAFILALLLVLSLTPTALAAEGLDNFRKTAEYTDGLFPDVSSTSWYAEYVKNAYELGLMVGSGDGFNPTGNLTIAEALVLACRLNSLYYGGTGVFQQGSPWYQVYVDYAIEKNMIVAGQYDYKAPATRLQFATILCSALPAEALTIINSVPEGAIPDVVSDAAVYTLYRAGILTGNDDLGTFHPESNIARSEVAAIVTRMAISELRKTVSLQPQQTTPVADPHETYKRAFNSVVDIVKKDGVVRENGTIELPVFYEQLNDYDTVRFSCIYNPNGSDESLSFYVYYKDFDVGFSLYPQYENEPYGSLSVKDMWLFLMTSFTPTNITSAVFEDLSLVDSAVDMSSMLAWMDYSDMNEELARYLCRQTGLSIALIAEYVDYYLLSQLGYSMRDLGFTGLPKQTEPPRIPAAAAVKCFYEKSSITIGDTVTACAVVGPVVSNVVWSSSNPAVARVEDGTIIGVGEGTATITATTSNGISDSFTFSVEKKNSVQKYNTITAYDGTDVKYSAAPFQFVGSDWSGSIVESVDSFTITSVDSYNEKYDIFRYTIVGTVTGSSLFHFCCKCYDNDGFLLKKETHIHDISQGEKFKYDDRFLAPKGTVRIEMCNYYDE
jgi:hypothetical protein